MKFHCPRPETYEQREHRRSKWHRVFAYLPHRVEDDSCRWLETILRRIETKYWTTNIERVKHYRAIK